MSDTIASGRYTRALFELAEKDGSLAEVDARLHAVTKILAAQPKVLLLMANPTLTNPEKYALALGTLAGGETKLLERFFRVLIDKKRFALLPDIQKLFHDRFEKKQGVQEVVIFSAVPFSSETLGKFKAVLTKKLRSDPPSETAGRIRPPAEIRLIPKTDRGILGGFILRFAGKEIDCSFKNRLYEIHQKIFSSAEEEIA